MDSYRMKVMEIAPRIEIDPHRRSGRPVVKGTRVPVALVLGQLAGGMSLDEVMKEYDLAREDILACLGYAAGIVEKEELRAVP